MTSPESAIGEFEIGESGLGVPVPGLPHNRDLACVAGDNALLMITATDGDDDDGEGGNVIGLMGVTAITFSVQETLEAAPVFTKTLAASQITLIDSGKTGQFSVTILPADTEPLAGYFLYQAKVTDDSGLIYTVAAGTLRISRSVPA